VWTQIVSKTVSIVRSSKGNDTWKQLKYKVFDAPELKKPFEERLKILQNTLKSDENPYVEVCEQEICKGVDHLNEKMSEVEKLGGEGLMLRQPKSLYASGRSNTLLKVKNFNDEEAKVIAHEPGKGKYSGLIGALWCEMANGKNFSVGSGLSDHDRANPPKIGSIITYRYQELSTAGIPRFPVFVGARIDAEWPPKKNKVKSAINPAKAKSPAPTVSKSYIQGTKKKTDNPEKEKHDKKEKPEKHKPEKKTISEKKDTSPKKPLSGYTFVFTGTHSVVRKALQEIVENNGGNFSDTISKSISYLVATTTEVEVGTNKVVKATKYNLPIVSEDFLHECIKRGKVVDYTPFVIG